MIHVYVTSIPDVEREEKRKAEHRTGLELLARGLRELYGLNAAAEELPEMLEEQEGGKPFLKEHPEIFFNISHSKDAAACAFGDGPIGVDIEKIGSVKEPLIRRVLHEKEKETLEAVSCADPDLAEAERRRLFFRYWTLKESYLKMKGTGLRTEPRDCLFLVDPESMEGPVTGPETDLFCRQMMIGEEYVLALCMKTQDEKTGPGTEPQVELFVTDPFDKIRLPQT